jgi:MATE family multidrug resistance protein
VSQTSKSLNVSESLSLVRIAWPLAIAYLGEIAMFVIDVLIVGRIGPLELAGVGISSTMGFEISVLAVATLSIVGVLISQANGREDDYDIAHRLRQGLLVSIVFSIPVIAILLNLEPFLVWTGQAPEVVAFSNSYLGYAAWSYLPGLGFLVLKEFSAALSRTRPVMVVTIIAIALKCLMSWMLVFGVGPFPVMGVGGAGLATTLVVTVMFIGLFVYTMHAAAFRHLRLFSQSWAIDWALWKRILRLGLPVGFIGAFEAGLFAFVAIMIGRIDPHALAANQIVFNFVGLSFMITMAVGDAAAIRVSYHLSKEDPVSARRSGVLALIMGTFNMTIAAILYIGFGAYIPGFIIDVTLAKNQATYAYAVSFFFIAAFFQLGDGLQAVATRALRGMEDTVIPMIIAIISYWVIGALGGYILAINMDFGAQGIWLGMAVGLSAAAVMMVTRYLILSKRVIQMSTSS